VQKIIEGSMARAFSPTYWRAAPVIAVFDGLGFAIDRVEK
jgi:hypothetical protein